MLIDDTETSIPIEIGYRNLQYLEIKLSKCEYPNDYKSNGGSFDPFQKSDQPETYGYSAHRFLVEMGKIRIQGVKFSQ